MVYEGDVQKLDKRELSKLPEFPCFSFLLGNLKVRSYVIHHCHIHPSFPPSFLPPSLLSFIPSFLPPSLLPPLPLSIHPFLLHFFYTYMKTELGIYYELRDTKVNV
jgi:hypothetical protein